MLRYLLRRLLIAVPVLLGITVIVFLLINLQPGDPYVSMISPEATEAQKLELLQRIGYFDPVWVKYLRWLGRLLQGDMGWSLQYGAPVLSILRERLGNTAILAGAAMTVTILVAVPLGLWAGLRRNGPGDMALSLLSFVIVSIPSFFLAMVLIKIFAADLKLLPSSGVVSVGARRHGLAHVLDVARHLVLPATVLAVTNIAIMNRYLRGSISELVDQDFVRALFARGLPRRRVVVPHLLRNAAKPLVTIISLEVPALLSSALLTETIFNWPGIGRLNFEAVQNRDYALLMGIILLFAVLTVTVNLLADLLYVVIDPRVRVS